MGQREINYFGDAAYTRNIKRWLKREIMKESMKRCRDDYERCR